MELRVLAKKLRVLARVEQRRRRLMVLARLGRWRNWSFPRYPAAAEDAVLDLAVAAAAP